MHSVRIGAVVSYNADWSCWASHYVVWCRARNLPLRYRLDHWSGRRRAAGLTSLFQQQTTIRCPCFLTGISSSKWTFHLGDYESRFIILDLWHRDPLAFFSHLIITENHTKLFSPFLCYNHRHSQFCIFFVYNILIKEEFMCLWLLNWCQGWGKCWDIWAWGPVHGFNSGRSGDITMI